jgi:hypothetical protein
MVFELWQLAVSERYVGIKQIEHNVDPRTLGLSEFTALLWSGLLILYWVWMTMLLFLPVAQVHGICLLAISAAGYMVRRNCRIKWVLVALTFEGAVRIGLLVSLGAYLWRHW